MPPTRPTAFLSSLPISSLSSAQANRLQHTQRAMKDLQAQSPTDVVAVPAKRPTPPPVAALPSKRPAPSPDTTVLSVRRVSPSATLPERKTALSAGYDLSASEAAVIPAKGRAVVQTGLQLAIPAGHYGRVAPRSGLANKNGIDVGAGVIDADYRGDLMVILFNFGTEDFNVQPGMRIAQLIIERIATPPVLEVESLENTERGANGFGSTGVSA